MGIWQNLAYSYEQNADAFKASFPLSTTSISNNFDFIVVIVIDGEGNCIRFDTIEKRTKATKKKPESPLVSIVIPVTEESMGRSSGICPHPVFDQYGYLKGEGEKFNAYLAQLKNFAESEFATKQVRAIYNYILKGSLALDLSGMKLKDKNFIVFQVDIPGDNQRKVWESPDFFDAWHQYYLKSKKEKASKKKAALASMKDGKQHTPEKKKALKRLAEIKDDAALDYIMGAEQEEPIAIFHPKKISNASANAKLISDNDKSNYTFRGKFRESFEAVSIGYETSQRAHQFLRYLINDGRCYYCGEQVILSFTIGSKEKLPPSLDDSLNIWKIVRSSQAKTEKDTQITLRTETGVDYADALKKALAGIKYNDAMQQHTKTAVVAFDAATTGRLSITFYREMERGEYHEKIAQWHRGCKWHQKFWDKENGQLISYIGAPSVDRIIEAVYGQPRGGNDESYIKIKKTSRERLLRCIFDGSCLPRDYEIAAIRRASRPLAISKSGKFDRYAFDQLVSTACALIRIYQLQTGKEEYQLSIESDRTERDYLFGRLLGAADKLEEYALHKKGNERVVTAAVRHMQTFANHPFRTWETIHSSLIPYIQVVKGSFAFKEIQAVKQLFETDEYENDAPLNGLYLIGYYHERAYIESLVQQAVEKKKVSQNQKPEKSDDEE